MRDPLTYGIVSDSPGPPPVPARLIGLDTTPVGVTPAGSVGDWTATREHGAPPLNQVNAGAMYLPPATTLSGQARIQPAAAPTGGAGAPAARPARAGGMTAGATATAPTSVSSPPEATSLPGTPDTSSPRKDPRNVGHRRR